MNYLITGGSGYIGQKLIQKINPKQHNITILSRKKQKFGYRTIQSLDSIKNNENIDIIINLAGSRIDNLWTRSNKKVLIDSRISTTNNIFKLIERLNNKPKLMLSASAIGYYGNNSRLNLDETAQPQKSFTFDLCNQWETAALKTQQLGVNTKIIRLGVVIGKNSNFINKIAIPFKLGLGGTLGSGQQFFSWIHIDDVVNGLLYLIDNHSTQTYYNFVSPHPVTNQQLTQAIGKVLHRPTIFNLPETLIKLIYGAMGQELLLQSKSISPKALQNAGYKFLYNQITPAIRDAFL